MTDTKALRDLIESRGLKYKYVAAVLGMSAYTLQRKIENDSVFLVSEVSKLVELFQLSPGQIDTLFFAK